MGFTVKRVLRRVLRRVSEQAVSRRCLERHLVEYAPLGVRPSYSFGSEAIIVFMQLHLPYFFWDYL